MYLWDFSVVLLIVLILILILVLIFIVLIVLSVHSVLNIFLYKDTC